MSQVEPFFRVEGLKKYFRVRGGKVVKAVDDVSFEVKLGETLSLVGESGCGKTTCGRTLLSIYQPTAGRVYYNGLPLDQFSGAQRQAFRKSAQMIFQDPYSSLDPRMTIGSTISEGMSVHFKLSAAERNRRVTELLATVGLTSDYASRFPHELSGGQRQRVGIARALAMEPEFILCDEPIASLDVSIQAQILNLLMKLQRENGLTYLFISHDLAVVRHISDRVGVMYLGKIVELAPVEELFTNPRHPYTHSLLSAIPVPDPDGSLTTRRIRLEGEVPSAIDPPSGCRFHTRCYHRGEICEREVPQLKDVGGGHFVACFLSERMRP
jgi:oligopeptide transport system ATP-binding protein